MSATIREIVDDALTVVGEVAGPGVQVYEDDRMKADAIRAFNMMFKKYNWPNYLKWYVVNLDGTTGVITTDTFEQVKDFEDFIAVHRNGESRRLPIAPTRFNPFSPRVAGVCPMFWTSLSATNANYAKRKLQVYPVTSQGPINVLAKEYPLIPPAVQFDWTQVFYLDKDMLVYATAFMTLAGDDLNAGGADVIRNLMEMKYRDVLSALSSHPIPIFAESDIPRTGTFVVSGDVGGGFLELNET